MSDKQPKNDVSKLPNYFSAAAIVPAVLSIMCYELVDYMVNVVFKNNPDYNPLAGLGMLIPMALMTELFTFFFTRKPSRSSTDRKCEAAAWRKKMRCGI